MNLLLKVLTDRFYSAQTNYLQARLDRNQAEREIEEYVRRFAPHLLELRNEALQVQEACKEAAEAARREMVNAAQEAVDTDPDTELPDGLAVRAETEVVLTDPDGWGAVVDWMCKNGLREKVTISFRGALDLIRHFARTNLLPKGDFGSPLIALETNPKVIVKDIDRWQRTIGAEAQQATRQPTEFLKD